MRDVRNSRQNMNMMMGLGERDNFGGIGFGSLGNLGGAELGMMLFNSPCKFHFAVND